MAEQNFVDYVKILFRSGSGGAGSVHFLRLKGVPKGGPDGVMVVEEVILSCVGMLNYGLYCI